MSGFDTQAVHAGRSDLNSLGVHAPPIDLSTTAPLPDLLAGGASYESMALGGHPGPGGTVYARLWNPTVARFEEALAVLEGAAEAVAFASGMAAMTAALLAATQQRGRHVVAVRPLYGGTDHLLGSRLLGTETTFTDPSGVAAAIRPETALVIVETPANPSLELVDIAAVVRAAGDTPVLVDNTFATPVLQNPLAHGAVMALHSATKYLGGHGDAVGGVIAADEAWAVRLRQVRAVTGALLHPFAGYLLHRGLATLPVRVRAQQHTAAVLATALAEHPQVARVRYPGLPGQDPTGLIGRQLRGPGAMIAVELRGGFTAAAAVTGAVQLFTHAVSLGGVDSLIQHPAGLTHRPVPAEARPVEAMVRLSIGLESADDLLADLHQGLDTAAQVAA